MNKLINTIDSLSEYLSINDVQTNALKAMVGNTINNRFEFSGEMYLLKDVHPSSLGEALTPYLVSGVMVTEKNMVLQARYIERKSAFEFEVDVTLEGLTSLLIENTSISKITVNPVYATDKLNIDNASQTINHIVSGDRTDLDGLYCIIDFDDGQSIMNQMNDTEAKQAMFANCHQRLNGVNPYLSENNKIDCYKLSCVRRTLKNISAMRTVKNCDYIATLLNLHDSQYNKAKELRKVVQMKHRFRGCSTQASKIDALFKQAQGSVVLPFSNKSKQRAKKEIDHSVFAPLHKQAVWEDDQEFGMGF